MNPCMTKGNRILPFSSWWKIIVPYDSPEHYKTFISHKTVFNALLACDHDNFKNLKVLDLKFMTEEIF